MGAHPVPLQYFQGMPPVQRIIGLVDLYKDLLQNLLPQYRDLLKFFGIQVGCPCSSPSYESVKNVVELNVIHQALVNSDSYCFPNHLHQADSVVLTSALGYKDVCGPSALRHLINTCKHHIYNIHNNLPPGGFVSDLYTIIIGNTYDLTPLCVFMQRIACDFLVPIPYL